MLQQILIAWDGSQPARRAFEHALDLAQTYDAELVAVSVAHSPARGTSQELVESGRELEDSFGDLVRLVEPAGVAIEHVTIEGTNPSHDILRYAHSHGFDLVVVGHHRHHRPERFLLQGIAEHMIAEADVPILIISDEPET